MNDAVVCSACGKPEGTGTLLDFQPDPPPAADHIGYPPEKWPEFAARYRCPVCVASDDLHHGHVGHSIAEPCIPQCPRYDQGGD